jgi:hypothetical protein
MTNLTVPTDYVADLRFEEIIYANEIQEGMIFILASSGVPRIWATAKKIRIGVLVQIVSVYPDETARPIGISPNTPLIVKKAVP